MLQWKRMKWPLPWMPLPAAPGHEHYGAKNAGALRVASVNVNGIRAAYKRGMAAWLAGRDVDVLCLQEVRAPDAIVRELLGEGWHVLHAEAEAKGRAGVAVASRVEPVATREHIGDDYFTTAGRWVEADFAGRRRQVLSVTSAYVHSGEVDTPKQVDKYRFLDVVSERLPKLRVEKDYALVVGDLNVGHTTRDIKNWKGNVKRAGFLPEERAYFDRFFGEEIGFKDVAPRTGRRRRRPLHLVVLARAGLRQRRRLAHRLPHGHPRARPAGGQRGRRPRGDLRRALLRPRPDRRRLPVLEGPDDQPDRSPGRHAPRPLRRRPAPPSFPKARASAWCPGCSPPGTPCTWATTWGPWSTG